LIKKIRDTQERKEWRREEPPRGKGATVESGPPISPYGIMDFASTFLTQTKQQVSFREPYTIEMPQENVGEETNVLPEDLASLTPGPEVGEALFLVSSQRLVPLMHMETSLRGHGLILWP
jgi:hypothetical protein